MIEDLEENIVKAGDKLTPLFVGFGAIAAYRCET